MVRQETFFRNKFSEILTVEKELFQEECQTDKKSPHHLKVNDNNLSNSQLCNLKIHTLKSS